MPVLTKSQLKKLSQEELLDYAKKVGNIEKPEKSISDFSKKFYNITKTTPPVVTCGLVPPLATWNC